jgi:hypothetical protein
MMKRLFSAKPLLAAAVVFAGLAAASAAHARSDVHLSIGVQVPFGYGYDYVQPAPVYVQPQPVYVQPHPVYVQPRPVYVQPQPVYYGEPRHHGRRGHWRDHDRDGVPNRYDRAPHNPYRY